MESSEFILTIAGLALGLAGFSGVIVGLNPTPLSQWDPVDKLNFRVLVQVAAVAAFFSLLPFPIHVVFEEERAWRIALLIYGIFHAIDVSTFVLRYPKNTPPINLRIGFVGCLVATLQIVIAFLGGATIIEATYLLGLMWHLCVSFFGFVTLVYQFRSKSKSTPAP